MHPPDTGHESPFAPRAVRGGGCAALRGHSILNLIRNSIYAPACFLLASDESNEVALLSMAQTTLSSRSATERKARAWPCPLALRASYFARLVASCWTALWAQ